MIDNIQNFIHASILSNTLDWSLYFNMKHNWNLVNNKSGNKQNVYYNVCIFSSGKII